MAATGAGTRIGVTLKLPQLQNLCKRDPVGYREDYDAQVRRLESECGILALSPSSDPSHRLVELIQFSAAVSSSSYVGEESDRIASMLIDLLLGGSTHHKLERSSQAPQEQQQQQRDNKNKASVSDVISMPSWSLQLHRDVRKACVSALILMRNKGAVEPIRLFELFFRILSVVPDKALREMLHRHIVNDIRNLNKKGKRDDRVNRSIQSFLHRVIGTHGQQQNNNNNNNSSTEAPSDIATKRATDMVCELYRRNVWTDDRTVAILASAVEAKNTTVVCKAIRFFLNIEDKMAQDKQQQDEAECSGLVVDYHLHSKKQKSRQRQTERQLKNKKKTLKKQKESTLDWMDVSPINTEDRGVEASKKLYPAIELIRDPQGLAESVLKRLRGERTNKYEVKLLMMNFVTRLVGNHELLLLPLYPFLQKYMASHQRDVTAILCYCIQACHEYVPPDEIYGILKTIAHNFITERCTEEQIAVGINSARAICARVPAVLSIEESRQTSGSTAMDIEAFARDLAGFANHRDRSVSMAGKTWQNFVREVHPTLLQGKHRGLKGSALHRAGTKPLRYGEQRVASGVEGADLLLEYEAKRNLHRQRRKNGEDGGDDDDDGSEQSLSDPAEDDEEESGVEEEDDDDDDDDEIAADRDDEKEKEKRKVKQKKSDKDDDDDDDSDDDDDDSSAPDLVELQAGEEGDTTSNNDTETEEKEKEDVVDLSKMSEKERDALKLDVSSQRVFSAADFDKMRRLVEREQRAKRDPREAARRKRRLARKGSDFEKLSDDDDGSAISLSDEEDDDEIRVTGAVNPGDIMALATRKRQSKAERLQKVIAGREQFEAKQRAGGSTNEEKKRNKNFLMSKLSYGTRTKNKGKKLLKGKRGRYEGKEFKQDAKKRRRKT